MQFGTGDSPVTTMDDGVTIYLPSGESSDDEERKYVRRPFLSLGAIESLHDNIFGRRTEMNTEMKTEMKTEMQQQLPPQPQLMQQPLMQMQPMQQQQQQQQQPLMQQPPMQQQQQQPMQHQQ